MYKVYLDDELLYHPNLVKQKNLSIEKTRLNVELNKTGSFTFVIRKNNPRYAQLKKMQSIVKVYDDNDRLFRGRILNSTRGLFNELQVTCEGELAFLLDSRVRPYEYTGSVADYHRFLVEQHNSQVDSVKQFKVGICTVTDTNDYISRASSDYPNTWDEFNEKLINLLGGYIWTREEEDGVYIDYLADFDEVNTQPIEFGENLLGFEETIKGQDIATAIIPLGCRLTTEDEDGNDVETEERLTIVDINNGVDYVYHEEAVNKYGLIFKVVEWDDVTIPENLKQKAEEELQNTIHFVRVLDLKAVDLRALNVNIRRFRLGRYTPVKSKPHELDEYLLTRKLSINILNDADSALLLGDEKQTFTDKHVEEKKETNLYIGQIIEENKTAIKDVVKVINNRIYSQISQASDNILIKVSEEYYTDDEIDNIVSSLNTAIEVSNGQILATVSADYATKNEVDAKLEFKVNADSLISEINASADIISLTGNRFIVDSDNMKISVDGTITAKNGKFTGDIVAESFEAENEHFKVKFDSNVTVTSKQSDYLSSFYALLEYDENAGGPVSMSLFPNELMARWGDTYSSFMFNGEEWFLDNLVINENLAVYGTTYLESVRTNAINCNTSIKFGGESYTTKYAIYTIWADGSNHDIICREDNGLSAFFGWAGSSSYATVSVIRGRTCKYQNSSGTTTLSDVRLKKDFTDLEKWDCFYDAIEPVAFKMKNGNSGRYHMGFKAQQIEQALLDNGLSTQDFAGFIKMEYKPDADDPEGNAVYQEAGIASGCDEYGLIYTEFIAMNSYQIQKLKYELMVAKQEIELLKILAGVA